MGTLSEDADKLDGCIAPSHYFGEEMKNRLPSLRTNFPPPQWYLPRRLRSRRNLATTSGPRLPRPPMPPQGPRPPCRRLPRNHEARHHPDLELRVAGGMTGDDNAYVHEQKKAEGRGLFEKPPFTPTSTVTKNSRSCATYPPLRPLTLPRSLRPLRPQALAAGIPVVLPSVGAFPKSSKPPKADASRSQKPEHLPDALEASSPIPKN